MRTIAVDDEPWMLKRFSIECEAMLDIELLGTFRNPIKALEFARTNNVELAFLDMEMPEMTGLELAAKLREIRPEVIIIFISAYESYMAEAFKSKAADYYIMKPYNSADLESAIDRARLLSGRLRKKILARTFGEFELFVNNVPVVFSDEKSKELLAILINKRGSVLSNDEACKLLELHEDGGISVPSRYNRLSHNLRDTLKEYKIDSLVEQNDSGLFLHTDVLDCDLFLYLDGDTKTMRQFNGSYMDGYSWAEKERNDLKHQSEVLGRYDDDQTRNTLCASIKNLDDEALTLTYMNEGFLAIVGYTREEIAELFNNSLRAMILRDDYEKAIKKTRELLDSGKPIEVEYRLVNKTGDEMWVLARSEPPRAIPGSDNKEISDILIDISGLKVAQHNLEQAASKDGLTGLYNRMAAKEKITQYMSDRPDSCYGALILMDIDNFKSINDTYGHPFADTVLTDIAAILNRSFRSSDIVSRLGGDEMMIFMKGVSEEFNAREKLAEATAAIADRLRKKTAKGEISCSFGGVLCPEDGADYDTLYQKADLALYSAKEKKNCTVWFSDIRMLVLDKLVKRELTDIDSEELNKTRMFEINNAEAHLEESENLFEAIDNILDSIGKNYDIGRIYVFEISTDRSKAVNTFEWNSDRAGSELDKMPILDISKLMKYQDLYFNSDNIFYSYDIRHLPREVYDLIEPRGTKSMLQCEMVVDGEVYGMVGFEECDRKKYWSGKQMKALADCTKSINKVLYNYRLKHGRSLDELLGGRNKK